MNDKNTERRKVRKGLNNTLVIHYTGGWTKTTKSKAIHYLTVPELAGALEDGAIIWDDISFDPDLMVRVDAYLHGDWDGRLF